MGGVRPFRFAYPSDKDVRTVAIDRFPRCGVRAVWRLFLDFALPTTHGLAIMARREENVSRILHTLHGHQYKGIEEQNVEQKNLASRRGSKCEARSITMTETSSDVVVEPRNSTHALVPR